ncbi:pentatricopeptide repeat-containing protein At4g20740 [Ipomoea triloba]|uniref:pentatricopeptide repeat-containing protein At4g20740 n=1 Tax=Ipomoea triloba TaxID=35885 RepID=UPI00125DDDD1|nr:pentatricopeptide repeat-containing protein At4g20740 [Ipomoea triloba]
MPPLPSPVATVKPHRPYFFYGHRKPTQNRPTVRGGLFSNRQTINPANTAQPTPYDPLDFDLRKWDPDADSRPGTRDPSQDFFSVAKSLSPIARYIVDSFRKHGRWGPLVVEDLNRLRRVTPKLVTEILKVPNIDPRLSSKFFYWAGKQKGYRHDFACYNAFAYSLNRTNQFRAADQIPELMHMQGKPPTEKQFEILIRMHADANRGLRVYYVYEKMKKFDIKPRVFLYNRIMDALVKTNHLDLALSVYDDFRKDGLVEETVTFMVLIKGLCKSGQVNEAIELLDQMRKNLCKPDVFAYTAMVKVLVSEGNLDGCSRVWEEMKRDGIEPDVMAYGTFITGLCKGNQLEKGYELFEEMKEKKYLIDRAIYGSLIEAFVTSGKVGSACDLLKDMMNSGYRADLAIYNCLIEGLCNHGLVDRAYKLLRVTVKEDLQPDFFTVSPILLSYAESKRIDDFISLLEQMQKLGFCIRDDLSKFFCFMVKKDNGIMLAWELFEELKLKYDCSVQSYNVLMEALHSIGKVDKALKLFQELNDKKLHCDSLSLSYSIAIQCFIEIDDIQEACSCYNRLREMSLVPSTLAYYSLVKKLCKIGEIDAAMMLIRDCLANVTNGPMEFKYTLTIIHVSKSNDAEKVVEVLSEMIEQGCPPNNIIHCAIICGMCMHGTIEEARKVFTAMRVRKLLTEAEVVVYDELLIEQMKKKTADLVLCGLKFFGLERKLKAKGSKILLD